MRFKMATEKKNAKKNPIEGAIFQLFVKKPFSQKRRFHVYRLFWAHFLAAIASYAFLVVVNRRIGTVAFLELKSFTLHRACLDANAAAYAFRLLYEWLAKNHSSEY